MDKALNQLSVPLGQLREEVLVCLLIGDNQVCELVLVVNHKHHILLQGLRTCVSEVIQAIDSQLSKQEDLQKKKVHHSF